MSAVVGLSSSGPAPPDLPPCTFLTTPLFSASFSLHPFTPLHILLRLPRPLSTLPREEFVRTLQGVRRLAGVLRSAGWGWGFEGVRRFGVASDGGGTIALIPMHGLDAEWKPMIAQDEGEQGNAGGRGEYSHFSTATTPHAPAEDLGAIATAIRRITLLDPTQTSPAIPGPHPTDNLFARLIRGELPTWKTHDTSSFPGYCAWLTPFPPGNSRGASVLVPRGWASSDVLAMEEGKFGEYMGATWDVARDVVRALGRPLVGGMGGEGDARRKYQSPTERVVAFALFFEGFEIDWAHTKIYPVWTSRPPPSSGTTASSTSDTESTASPRTPADPDDASAYYAARTAAQLERERDEARPGAFHEVYPGYLSTRPAPRVSAERERELEELARRMGEGVRAGMGEGV